MSEEKVKPYTDVVKDLMGKKSFLLSKAQALSEVGMVETAQPLFLSAAAYEECIAPLLDALGRELEAAVHRISAASCYQKAGPLHHAVNLYRAALAGPLREDTRSEVEKMLYDCLEQLTRQPMPAITAPPVQEALYAI
ncbi:hypothetical protein HYR99_07395 [Candidatus Poribacteria bacterium]|nr:hypothetical protein [Candidatus Poribacteria bacterium]